MYLLEEIGPRAKQRSYCSSNMIGLGGDNVSLGDKVTPSVIGPGK